MDDKPVGRYAKAMGIRTAQGLNDGLKNEFYRSPMKMEEGLQADTRCMKTGLASQNRHLSWACSLTN